MNSELWIMTLNAKLKLQCQDAGHMTLSAKNENEYSDVFRKTVIHNS